MRQDEQNKEACLGQNNKEKKNNFATFEYKGNKENMKKKKNENKKCFSKSAVFPHKYKWKQTQFSHNCLIQTLLAMQVSIIAIL